MINKDFDFLQYKIIINSSIQMVDRKCTFINS